MTDHAERIALVEEAQAYLKHAPFNFPEGVSLIRRLAAALTTPKTKLSPDFVRSALRCPRCGYEDPGE